MYSCGCVGYERQQNLRGTSLNFQMWEMHDSDLPPSPLPRQANAGCCRPVISVQGGLKELSSDHKPWDRSELQQFVQGKNTHTRAHNMFLTLFYVNLQSRNFG